MKNGHAFARDESPNVHRQM